MILLLFDINHIISITNTIGLFWKENICRECQVVNQLSASTNGEQAIVQNNSDNKGARVMWLNFIFAFTKSVCKKNNNNKQKQQHIVTFTYLGYFMFLHLSGRGYG